MFQIEQDYRGVDRWDGENVFSLLGESMTREDRLWISSTCSLSLLCSLFHAISLLCSLFHALSLFCALSLSCTLSLSAPFAHSLPLLLSLALPTHTCLGLGRWDFSASSIVLSITGSCGSGQCFEQWRSTPAPVMAHAHWWPHVTASKSPHSDILDCSLPISTSRTRVWNFCPFYVLSRQWRNNVTTKTLRCFD